MKYKFLNLEDKTIKSNSGDLTWKVGKWIKHDGKLELCKSGLQKRNGITNHL